MMEFEGGVTVSFTMEGHSHDNVRTMRYSGTRATVRGHTGFNQLTLHDYVSGEEERFIPELVNGGHGGGDWGSDGSVCGRPPGTARSGNVGPQLAGEPPDRLRRGAGPHHGNDR